MKHSVALGLEISRLLDMADDITPGESSHLMALASTLGSSVRISRWHSMTTVDNIHSAPMQHTVVLSLALSRLLDMAEEGYDITHDESAHLMALASALGSSVRTSRWQSMTNINNNQRNILVERMVSA